MAADSGLLPGHSEELAAEGSNSWLQEPGIRALHMYMLCAMLGFGPSEDFVVQSVIRALCNNLRMAHTILRFITVMCKVRIYNIYYGYSS